MSFNNVSLYRESALNTIRKSKGKSYTCNRFIMPKSSTSLRFMRTKSSKINTKDSIFTKIKIKIIKLVCCCL